MSVEVRERFPALGPCPDWLGGKDCAFYAHSDPEKPKQFGKRISPSEMTRPEALQWLSAALKADTEGATEGERAVALALAGSSRLVALCQYARENLMKV